MNSDFPASKTWQHKCIAADIPQKKMTVISCSKIFKTGTLRSIQKYKAPTAETEF